MNVELVLTIISLLGDVQMPHAGIEPAKLTATYATWVVPVTVEYQCPDQSSGIDPMGQTAVITKAGAQKDGTWTAVSVPIVLYPKTQTCAKDARENHHKVFLSMADASAFKAACSPGKCEEWETRPATETEIIDYALELRHWKMDHYPGGDPAKYPNGVYEVWPANETRFDDPVGQGSTALGALANALGSERS